MTGLSGGFVAAAPADTVRAGRPHDDPSSRLCGTGAKKDDSYTSRLVGGWGSERRTRRDETRRDETTRLDEMAGGQQWVKLAQNDRNGTVFDFTFGHFCFFP